MQNIFTVEERQVSLNDYRHIMCLMLYIIQKEPMISVTIILLNVYNALARYKE